MSDDRTVPERVADLELVEAMLTRLAATDAEAGAARRLLGVDTEAEALSAAYAPDRPPPAPVGTGIDHAAHARETVARYSAWVASHPDDDPTPLTDRERALRLARFDLHRLEGGS